MNEDGRQASAAAACEAGPGDERLLDLPAPVAATRLARLRLAEARAAAERLSRGRDDEALHDFRVALRRLRSLLRAHRRSLGRAARRKLLRRLRDLAATTNPGRDAEVQIEWLESCRTGLSRGQRSGLNWMLARLRLAKRTANAAFLRQARPGFTSFADELESRLDAISAGGPPLCETMAKLLRTHLDDLHELLARALRADQVRPVHECRIAAKRLRYLLEPLRDEAPEAAALLRRLKGLQDVLGDLHDVQVLESSLEAAVDEVSRAKGRAMRELALAGDEAGLARERRRDERVGLVALAAVARRRREELYAAFSRQWDEAGAGGFFADASAFAAKLAPPVAASPAAEAAGDAAPVEIERKYLLRGLPSFAQGSHGGQVGQTGEVKEIEQGWLPGRVLRERIRRVRSEGGERYYRTVKLGAGVTRIELEEETTAEVFAAMWPLTEGCRIRKRRHVVPVGDRTWEIDEFLDRDLAMAEIELSSADEPVEFPPWLAPLVLREVTDDGSYTNLALATAGPRQRERQRERDDTHGFEHLA